MAKPKIVKHVLFHQSIFVGGLGNLGTSLPPTAKTIQNLKMYTSDEGLVVEGIGPSGGGTKTAIVPFANIVVMEVVAD